MAKKLCPICRVNTFGSMFGMVAKDGQFCGKCWDKLYSIKGKNLNTKEYTISEIGEIIGEMNSKSVTEPQAKEKVGEEQSLFGKMRESALRRKEEAAIANAYKIERDKRKSHIKRVKHERPLTPQEQQAIDMITAERDAKIAEWSRQGVGFIEATMTRTIPYDNKIEEIRNRTIWYEEVLIPPEIDPSIPIVVDEQAIKERIRNG